MNCKLRQNNPTYHTSKPVYMAPQSAAEYLRSTYGDYRAEFMPRFRESLPDEARAEADPPAAAALAELAASRRYVERVGTGWCGVRRGMTRLGDGASALFAFPRRRLPAPESLPAPSPSLPRRPSSDLIRRPPAPGTSFPTSGSVSAQALSSSSARPCIKAQISAARRVRTCTREQ